jgi:flagellin
VNNLGVAFENASAAESAIRDTDFAEETANLTRSQILAQAATTVLAQANASPQAALQLLQ